MTNLPSRSTKPSDYQDIPQTIAVMAKVFLDGTIIPLHMHKRHQILYALSGVMRLQTERTSFVVPPDRAIFIPANTPHSVSIHGDVDMRTLYVSASTDTNFEIGLKVLAVTGLLRELILALSEEPIEYNPGSRGARLARLIEDEFNKASELSNGIPLPRDPRLQKLCAAILADLSDSQTLDSWANIAGASPRTFARLFDSDLGMSFQKWRQRCRFNYALEALSEGHRVAQVARDCGYSSPSAFTAAFAKATGLKPSEVG